MNKVLLDACVLFPNVTRALLMGAAAQGLFQPLWSARILEEWRRTGHRCGVGLQSEIEIALLKSAWPQAEMPANETLEASLTLPDINDRHVLASAITGRADALITRNLKDFPTRVLARHGIIRRDPDTFLLEMAACIEAVVMRVHHEAQEMAGAEMTLRALLKKARLPRLGKFYS